MGNVTVKNGTPLHGESLCKTCTWAHWQKGFRESEEIVFCDWGPLRRVPFAVAECTQYTDTRIPSMESLEKMATILGQSRRVAGFAQDEEENSDKDNLVTIR